MTTNFEAIFEQVTVPLTVAAAEAPNVLIFANKAFCDMTGYSKEELIGINPGQLLQRNEETSDARKLIRHKLEANEKVDVLIVNYRKDGSKFWNGLHIHPVIDTTGKCIYWVGTPVDVTNHVLNVTTQLEELVSIVKTHFSKMKVDLSNF